MIKRIRLMGPVFFRLVLLCCLCLALAGITQPVYGFGVLVLGLFLEILMHLNYIARLAQWLEDPESKGTPNVRSALWSEIFYRVAKSRKALEKNSKRLAEREARYRKTLASLPEGIILCKKDWTVTWCNDNAGALFGINGEEDSGRHILAFLHEEALQRFIKSGNFDEPFIWRRSLPEQVIEISVVTVDRKTTLVVTRDITEQERLDAMRRDFVANVSHELRTPLTVLNGFLDMALHGIGDDAPAKAELQLSHMKLMQDQAGRMQRLINDLLTLSRLETGNGSVPLEVFSLSELLSNITEEIRVMASGTHTVTSDIEPVMMRGKPDELRSAVVNLMTNAVRYTPAGGTVALSCKLTPEGTIEVSVKDNGIGIAEKDIPRLTERFYRVDKSRSRDTGGTGLGLAIVKHVLIHHNARMSIQSKLGEGSTFSITFPSFLVATGEAKPEESLQA